MNPQSAATCLVHEPLLAHSIGHPDRPALADIDQQFTYGELASAIEKRATILRSAGIAPGDRVVLVAANAAATLITHFAILRAGAVSVPVGNGLTTERLSFIARDCAARAICADDGAQAVSRDVAGADRLLLGVGELAILGQGTTRIDHPAGRGPDDVACLMYTTGSTGDPKAVVLSHRSIGNALAHIIEFLGCSEADREAIVLPLSHSFGLGHAYCTLSCGGFLWVNDGLRPLKAFLDALPKLAINAMPTTPSMLRLLLGPYRTPFLRSAAGLRRLVINSERLPPEQAIELLDAMPQSDAIVYYGLTEASRSTFLRLRQEPSDRYRSVGKPAPRVEIEISDPQGAFVSRGVEGEVCIRGPHLALGYWQRPEEQAATFRNGWLHSGDLGVIDDDGYLTITGRLKDQINVGGLKVSAAEIEGVLRRHPGVADVAVTGVPAPDNLRREMIAIAVVARHADFAADDVAAFCAQNLDATAQPHRIAMVKAIPRAESGKVLKGDVQRLVLDSPGWKRA